jgi:hypothetical protein
MVRTLGSDIRPNHAFREKRSTCGYKYAARRLAEDVAGMDLSNWRMSERVTTGGEAARR